VVVLANRREASWLGEDVGELQQELLRDVDRGGGQDVGCSQRLRGGLDDAPTVADERHSATLEVPEDKAR
jgi:hypothetical protein